MKYFTPDLIVQLDSSDGKTANAADAKWDRRLVEYEKHLEEILPGQLEHIRQYQGLLLHDAEVWLMTHAGDQLTLILQKDIPPRDVVQLTYALATEPVINREALPREPFARGMYYLYNEFDVLQANGRTVYTESILFSNGWEVALQYTDVRVAQVQPLYPVAEAAAIPKNGQTNVAGVSTSVVAGSVS